jgi:hypothetical protein
MGSDPGTRRLVPDVDPLQHRRYGNTTRNPIRDS